MPIHPKPSAFIPAAALLAAISFTGCTASQFRTGGDVVGAAGGGILANKLSHGNPWITAAGAGGGALIADVAGSQIEHAQNSAEKTGYQRGQSDATKQLYWAQQALQKRQDGEDQGQTSLYDIPLPETTEQGAILAPRTRTLRIDE